ncbi:MAG: hypothetical protein CSB01_02155 [Bacteroidia bacterium]|nr:MAG: hypothetical protein CSB01_02155 [Bacteroidia bacterium]
MTPNKILNTWLLVVLLPIMALSQTEENNLQINGFVDTYHAVRVKSPNDFMSSRTRFRGELQKAFGKSSMFVSFNLNQNSILKAQNGFELREAYFDYSAKHWSLRAGRQLIIWGAADGLRITDLVSPMDMTEFLARDYDDIRMPVEALRFKYFRGTMQLELVYVPVFKGFVLPSDPKNPWAMSMPVPPNMQLVMQAEQKPDLTLENSEFGGRLTFNLPGIDVSLAALHTYDKMPVFINSMDTSGLMFVTPQYHRMTFVGGDFSKPLGQFVVRGEAAFNINKHLVTRQMPTQVQKHNTLNALLGIDWYAPNEWMLSVQIANDAILDYKKELLQEENTSLLTFNMSKNLLNSTLKLSNFIYTDLNNGGFFNRFSADYSLSDQIHLLVGYDHFGGDKGIFGMFKNNSELWIKAKYSF